MGLHIVIGFKSQSASAEPFPVYVGRDGTAALAAMETSDAARFERFSNAIGIRKNNPRAAVNVAAKVQAETAEKAKAEAEAAEASAKKKHK